MGVTLNATDYYSQITVGRDLEKFPTGSDEDTIVGYAKKIQEYIQNQLKDDLEYDQMTLKEYIDPFTGEPVKTSK